jgi:hydrogenase assembly chaperone HypC/HupF
MCLSIPGKVTEIRSNKIKIDYGSEERVVEQSVVDVKEGDYVIVNNKIIVSRVDKEKAEKFLEIIR